VALLLLLPHDSVEKLMARVTSHPKVQMRQSGHRIVRAEFALQPTCAPGGMLTAIQGKE